MKSFNDAEGMQDFIDDKIQKHSSKAYATGFRHGAFIGFFFTFLIMLAFILSLFAK